jgi:hypothetical protein
MHLTDNEKMENAVVRDAQIRFDRGVFLSVWLTLDFGSSVQGFGGYCLGKKGQIAETPIFAEWIRQLMEIFDVDRWDDIKGKPCRAVHSHMTVSRVGHYLKDKWFVPEDLVGDF